MEWTTPTPTPKPTSTSTPTPTPTSTPTPTPLSGKSDSGAAGPLNGAKKIPVERPRDLYCQSAAQRGHPAGFEAMLLTQPTERWPLYPSASVIYENLLPPKGSRRFLYHAAIQRVKHHYKHKDSLCIASFLSFLPKKIIWTCSRITAVVSLEDRKKFVSLLFVAILNYQGIDSYVSFTTCKILSRKFYSRIIRHNLTCI